MSRDYREDIDWLRAIAVLPVVLFHYLEPPANFGGFVGVDIFFVISGYLITGIVQSEVKDGTFSLTRFYERRVRRLLPALYVMVTLTAIPSFHYLLASERAEFFRSVAAVVTFTSNFFFWLQSGYFDHAAVEKPLLHTWSLAVEEQFYLVLPPFIWALLVMGRGSRAVLAAGLTALTLASFALAVWLMRSGASAQHDRKTHGQRRPRRAARATRAIQEPAAVHAVAAPSAAGRSTRGRSAADRRIRAGCEDEDSVAGVGQVRLRLRARCHVSGAAMSGHARWRRAAGLGPCASHGGGIRAGDAEAAAQAGPEAGLR